MMTLDSRVGDWAKESRFCDDQIVQIMSSQIVEAIAISAML